MCFAAVNICVEIFVFRYVSISPRLPWRKYRDPSGNARPLHTVYPDPHKSVSHRSILMDDSNPYQHIHTFIRYYSRFHKFTCRKSSSGRHYRVSYPAGGVHRSIILFPLIVSRVLRKRCFLRLDCLSSDM